jgi:hypothetical protein
MPTFSFSTRRFHRNCDNLASAKCVLTANRAKVFRHVSHISTHFNIHPANANSHKQRRKFNFDSKQYDCFHSAPQLSGADLFDGDNL